MMTHSDPPFLAADGGGTRCRLALCDRNGRIHITETGSANVTSSFTTAVQEILRGVDLLAQQAGLSAEELTTLPTYLGLAGITGPDTVERLVAALPFKQIRIEDDRPAALRGVLGARDGMVAHCGTGSFIATQLDGAMRFVGGWGPVLGDPASAQWVGRQALARSLDVVDGLVPASDLSDHILSELNGAAGVVAFAASATPAELGRFAPVVTRLADAGCPASVRILSEAAEQISATLTALGWHPGLPICLTGGIGPCYASHLPGDMQAALTAPDGSPLDGAIALAREFARERANSTNPRGETHACR